MRKYSRREAIASLLALVPRPLHLNARSTVTVSSTASQTPANVGTRVDVRTFAVAYRVDAAILLLGLPIFRRTGVGDGKASVDEIGSGAGLRRTLFFGAASDPKRAHGLSRLGWMREVVVGPVATPLEITYSGILTSSPEESLDQARKSVAEPASGRRLFSAVSGRNISGHSRSAIAHFESEVSTWSDAALFEQAQSLFDANAKWRQTSWPKSPDHAPPTFLHQLATLLAKRTRSAAGRYVYNEQEYLVEIETQQRGSSRTGLLAFRGKTRNLRTRNETRFRVWLEDSSASIVPVRCEIQPRSFLRLTFEAVPAQVSLGPGSVEPGRSALF